MPLKRFLGLSDLENLAIDIKCSREGDIEKCIYIIERDGEKYLCTITINQDMDKANIQCKKIK